MLTVAQQCKCTKCYYDVNVVKTVCFILCDFYHNKKKFRIQDDDRKNKGVRKHFHVYNWVIRILLSFTSLKMS